MVNIKKNPCSNRSKRWISYNDFSLDSVKSHLLNILSDYPFYYKFNSNNSKLFIKFNKNCYYIKVDYDNIGLILVNRVTGIKKYYYNFSSWRDLMTLLIIFSVEFDNNIKYIYILLDLLYIVRMKT